MFVENYYKLYVWNLRAGGPQPAGDYHTVMLVTLASSLETAKAQIRTRLEPNCQKWAESMAQVDPEFYDSSYARRKAEVESWLDKIPEVYSTMAPMVEWVEHTG